MSKIRADLLIVEKGLVSSREKAKRIIMEGKAFVGTNRIDKAGQLLEPDSNIHIKKDSLEFVSRGGYKLKKMIQKHHIDLKDKICMDIGSSTGGFTDCMLQNGSKKVYAIDVGYNQLDYKIRIDKRVVVMERTNIRFLDREKIMDNIDFISIDVSFISLELVLPKAVELAGEKCQFVALIKPQFEAGKDKVGKGGIIRDSIVHLQVLEKIYEFVKSLNLSVRDISYSPITGTEGNIEFLIYMDNYSEDNKSFDLKAIVNEAKVKLTK